MEHGRLIQYNLKKVMLRNTIFILLRSIESAEELVEKIRKRMSS